MSFRVNENIILKLILFAIALGILIASGSFYRYIYSYNLIMFAVLLLICAIIFIKFFIPTDDKYYVNTNISLSGLIILSVFIFFPLLSDVYNQAASYEITYFQMALMLLTFLLGARNREYILKYYLYLIVILSAISLIYFTIELFSEIPSFLPYYGIPQKAYSNFYYIWSGSANKFTLIVRNQSIFWEPGAFGFHLIVAILLAYKMNNRIFISILLLACLTTLSTTVYIFLSLLFIYHVVGGNNKLRFIGFSILILILILSGIKFIFGDFEILLFIARTILEKFSISSASYQSFYERMLYTTEALNLFLDNLILGAGHYSTAVELENIISETSGLAGLLAELGIIGAMSIVLYMRFFKYFKIIAIPIALVWLNGEYMQYTPLALIILTHMIDDIGTNLFPRISTLDYDYNTSLMNSANKA